LTTSPFLMVPQKGTGFEFSHCEIRGIGTYCQDAIYSISSEPSDVCLLMS